MTNFLITLISMIPVNILYSTLAISIISLWYLRRKRKAFYTQDIKRITNDSHYDLNITKLIGDISELPPSGFFPCGKLKGGFGGQIKYLELFPNAQIGAGVEKYLRLYPNGKLQFCRDNGKSHCGVVGYFYPITKEQQKELEIIFSLLLVKAANKVIQKAMESK